MAKKLLISALEPSANLHLGEILKELKDYEICGIFDEKFGSPYAKSSEFSAMGFFEILPLILKAKRALKALVKMARECDAVLLIDSPAFKRKNHIFYPPASVGVEAWARKNSRRKLR